MSSPRPLSSIAEQLLQFAELRRAGSSERVIAAAARSTALVRLRQGWYVRKEFWEQASPEVRHRSAILAAQFSAARPPVFSHRSAAVLHELPALSQWLHAAGRTTRQADQDLRRVHVTLPQGSPTPSSLAILRHRSELSDADVESHDGLRRTTPDRTLADLARSETFAVALACADAHLRATTRVRQLIDEETLLSWREDMFSRAARLRGRPGSRAVYALGGFADPRADSPLESISRLRFAQLGIDVELQVAVRGSRRATAYLDFVLRAHGVWGEADGKQKYVDAGMRGGRSAEEVVYAEKRRADWIAGTTGLRPVRWGPAEVLSRERFEAHLVDHGVPVPGEPSARWGQRLREFLRELP